MSEKKESPNLETPWVDSIAGTKTDLIPDVQCENAHLFNGYSFGGMSCQGISMSLNFPLTAHCPCSYDNSFLEVCHYPVGPVIQPEDTVRIFPHDNSS